MSKDSGAHVDLVIVRGDTFTRTLRAAARPFIYKPITGITQAAPARITATGHGIPDGWPVAVVSVKGMRQINCDNDPPRERDFHEATVVDVNTIELNDVNSSDFSEYTSGGYLQLYTPTDLAGATARMTIRDAVGGTDLVTLDSAGHGIALDNTTKTIVITVPADDTAGYTWSDGVYEVKLDFGGGNVVPLMHGAVRVEQEV